MAVPTVNQAADKLCQALDAVPTHGAVPPRDLAALMGAAGSLLTALTVAGLWGNPHRVDL